MSNAKPHSYQRGDRVEVLGADTDGHMICEKWLSGVVIQSDMKTVTVNLDGSDIPRTVLPGRTAYVRRMDEEGKIINFSQEVFNNNTN